MYERGVARELVWHDTVCPNVYGELSLLALLLYLVRVCAYARSSCARA